ncbi:E3 ubiquitin-protein ligase PRT6 [Pelomyxa schiedti]|nr:E3 ubiquitin-protein ligase PRT6 [Pelomyxa schiedti]
MNRGERDNNRAGVDERRRRFLDEGEEVAEPDLAAILADLERERRVECFVEDVREHGVRVAVLKFVQSSPSFTDDIVVMAENCILASLLALKPTSAKIDLIMWGIGFRAPNLSHQEVVRCAPKPSVCGLVWKNGDTAYKCRTCESDPTCAICVQCFSEGDHTGHDYRMISTGGGCCDCGDRAAWQESGFCRHHRGSSSDDPSTFLPPDIVPTSTATLRATARYLSLLLLKRKGCPAEFRTKSDPSVAAAQVVVGCLLGLCKEMGEGMGRLLSLALCHIPAQSCSPLKAILISDLDIPDELRSQIHTLLFHLLGDQYFKAEFARSLIGNYHQLVRRDMEIVAEENNGILGFSVQLFTVKGLSCEMVTTASLLEVLCGTTLEFIQKSLTTTSSTSERPSVSVKALSRIQSKYWRLFTDLHYVLQHVDCAQALLYQHPIALKDFINIISFFQGMNPQCRAVKEHVLFPSTDWIPAVNLESEFMTLLPLLISGISIPPKIAPVDASRLLCASLDSWLSALQHSQYRGYELITYTPLADPLTFHLPLHRFVAQFLRAMVMDFGVSVTEILDNCSPNFLLCFMHHPLKIQAALSQIRLGLWVRNGSGVQEQAQIYKTSPISWDYGYRLDLFIIQFVASLLPASHILSVFLQAFCCNTGEVIWCGFPQTNVELASGESLVPPGTTSGLDKAQCSGLVEDFLSFVVTVAVSERSLCGIVDPEFLIRRELLHFLAIANQTHSSLEKHLPATLSKNPHFDDILSSLSSFIEPKAMEPGHFVISSKCWDEYDAYFRHPTFLYSVKFNMYTVATQGLNLQKLMNGVPVS